MNNFDEQLLRLKQAAKTTADKDVAALLGLTKAAFSDRKKRGAFPEDKLFALASRRPELQIDANYVLHGPDAKQVAAAKAAEWIAGLPSRLRQVRGKKSVPAFAKLLGLQPDDVNDFEAGSRNPSAELLERYSTVNAEFSLLWIIKGESVQLDKPITDEEILLIRNYRVASAEGQESLRRAAAFHREFASRPQATSPSPNAEIDLVADYRGTRK